MKKGVRVVLSQTRVLRESMDFSLPLPLSFGEGGRGGGKVENEGTCIIVPCSIHRYKYTLYICLLIHDMI